ncbi:hypothetical protein [Bradyrhizobium japonicum]|uniref:hypothetical protein n=1 Tax=Bradyrhizobium japonicum TaxID=375 RepID=UPI00200D3261|nr:hypothetical protein [Bradyrhizobium japonicum]UQD96116.1 hypothetical protein JEY30_31735 [Bradyrhizobium japonicum]
MTMPPEPDPIRQAQGLIADAIAILDPVLRADMERLDAMKHLREVKLESKVKAVREALDNLDLAHGELIKLLIDATTHIEPRP